MNPQTTASAAAAPAAPSSGVTQLATAPGTIAGTESPTTGITPVAPPNATPVATANDIVNAPADVLASRYGIAEPPEIVETEDGPQGGAPTAEAHASPNTTTTADPDAPAAPSTGTASDPAIITQPITPFEFYDEQGALEIPANVKLGFKADGKEYKDLRLDEVVRMAQQAPLAAKHLQEAERLRPMAERTQVAETATQQLVSEIQRNNALYERLLSDPALYQEAANQFAAQNTPEHRLARIQEEAQTQTQQYHQTIQAIQLQHTIAAAQDFTASRIAPSVERLSTQYPGVESGDVMAKFHELTAPLMAPSPTGGIWVPPHRLQELEASVLPQLDAWAKGRAAKVSAQTSANTAQVQAAERAAQTASQLAKRQLARPLTPAGTRVTADVPKPPPIKSAGDAIEASLAKARSQIAGYTHGAA